IDHMRSSLFQVEYAHERWVEGMFYTSGSVDAQAQARTQRVEDMLRTYMMAGIGPTELAEKAEKAKAEQKAWYEQCRLEKEE
ncbi:hypothetical protein, partial [Klebsiella aerogenes]|uniref:hypothetical protein n=1 Tax=Klebsiella aerogenes TaxID=548 RepID=UPI001CBBFE9E